MFKEKNVTDVNKKLKKYFATFTLMRILILAGFYHKDSKVVKTYVTTYVPIATKKISG